MANMFIFKNRLLMVLCCLWILLLAIKNVHSFKTKTLHISGYVPINVSVSLGWSAAGILPSLQMGFADINNSTDILYDYKLKIDWNDTQCLAGYSTSLFMKEVTTSPTKIMLVGDGCSMSTQPIAETAPYYNLIMISYIAASPVLSDKKRYKTFFRMAMPDSSYNGPRFAVMKKFGWKRIATIHQSENSNYFSLMTADMLRILREDPEKYDVIAVESFQDDPRSQVENLMKKDARIIIVNMYSAKARLVFCWAHKFGMLNSTVQRVWMLPGFYYDGWWKAKDDTPCTPQELENAVNRILLTDTLNLRTDGVKSIGGITAEQYQERFNTWPTTKDYKANAYHPYGYDTAWAVALTLNKTLEKMKANPTKYKNKLLENFSYDNSDMLQLMMKEMFALHFEGVTGTVEFNELGDRNGTLTVLQRVNGTKRFIAIYDGLKNSLQMKGDFDWRDNRTPSDGSKNVKIDIPLTIDTSLCFVVVAFAALGVAISAVFFYFNHKFRNTPIMKMSSAKLNVLICIGAIMMYLSLAFYAIYESSKYNKLSSGSVQILCELWKWFLPIGFTLAFGAIFSKTFRIYVIYASVQGKPRRRKILDKSLFKLIGLLLFIDFVILILWSAIDPLRPTVETISKRVSTVDPDVTYYTLMVSCTSPYMTYFMLVLGTEKAVFLLFGGIVAYGTRNVSIKELNDSKLITIVVYNFILIAIVTGPLRFALRTIAPTGYFAADAILIWLCITTMLCIIFVPKLKKVNKVTTQDITKSMNGNNNSNDNTFINNRHNSESFDKSLDSLATEKKVKTDSKQSLLQ